MKTNSRVRELEDGPAEDKRGEPYTDPGAVDNRLTLNPNDTRWEKKIGDWADGEDYTITLKVRQISPGEFEVTELSGSGGSEKKAQSPKTPGKVSSGVSKMESGDPEY